jgi:hypothetical protein
LFDYLFGYLFTCPARSFFFTGMTLCGFRNGICQIGNKPPPHTYLDYLRLGEPRFFSVLQDKAETTTPMLYQVKFPEDSGNNTIPDP